MKHEQYSLTHKIEVRLTAEEKLKEDLQDLENWVDWTFRAANLAYRTFVLYNHIFRKFESAAIPPELTRPLEEQIEQLEKPVNSKKPVCASTKARQNVTNRLALKKLSMNLGVDIGDRISVSSIAYDLIKSRFNGLPSDIQSAVATIVDKHFRADRDGLKKGSRSARKYKGMPIPMKLKKTKETTLPCGIVIAQVVDQYSVAWEGKRFVTVGIDKKSRAAMELALKGRLCDSGLKMAGGKIFFLMTVKHDIEQVELLDNLVLGVDLGIYIPAQVSLIDRSLPGVPFLKSKPLGSLDSFGKRRDAISNQYRRAQTNLVLRGGRGRRGIRRSKKEANFTRTYNHKLSRRIVNMAVKMKAAVIQLEDLAGISKKKTFLKKWPFYQLQQMIKEKAARYGIRVRFVKAANTSRKCIHCGGKLERVYVCECGGTRKQRRTLVCACGKRADRDLVGSVNVAWSIEYVDDKDESSEVDAAAVEEEA